MKWTSRSTRLGALRRSVIARLAASLSLVRLPVVSRRQTMLRDDIDSLSRQHRSRPLARAGLAPRPLP